MNERERAEDEREDEEIQQRIREMHEEEEEDSRELEMIFEVQDLEGGQSKLDQPANLMVFVVLPDGSRVEKGFRRFDTGREASQFLKELIEDTCRRPPCPN